MDALCCYRGPAAQPVAIRRRTPTDDRRPFYGTLAIDLGDDSLRCVPDLCKVIGNIYSLMWASSAGSTYKLICERGQPFDP